MVDVMCMVKVDVRPGRMLTYAKVSTMVIAWLVEVKVGIVSAVETSEPLVLHELVFTTTLAAGDRGRLDKLMVLDGELE